LQALIDLRLDTIDRLLLNHLPRQDRLNIVSEVEAQIFELLSETANEEPTRDDLLAVLGQLDPPEAYVPEDAATFERPTAQREPVRASQRTSAPSRREGRAAKAGFILGLVSLSFLLIVPAVYTVGLMLESWEIALLGILLAGSTMLVTGVLGMIFSLYSGLRGPWSVTGLIASAVALLAWLAGGVLVLFAGL